MPSCGYRIAGIDAIRLLDFADFNGFKFDGGELYSNCLVTAVLRSGELVEVDSPETAKYTSSLQAGIYTHTLETFIGDLSAEMEATLHLATKRRYIVLFRTKNGRYHTFAYEAGATVTYANQTAEGVGSLVTITANSIYPLFEIADISVEWADYINIWKYMPHDTESEWTDYINIWKEICRNDFSFDFNNDFNCGSPTEPYVVISTSQVWFQQEPEGGQQIGIQSNTDWNVE